MAVKYAAVIAKKEERRLEKRWSLQLLFHFREKMGECFFHPLRDGDEEMCF